MQRGRAEHHYDEGQDKEPRDDARMLYRLTPEMAAETAVKAVTDERDEQRRDDDLWRKQGASLPVTVRSVTAGNMG
jgi:hypothetical protein